MYGIMMGKVYSSFLRAGFDSTDGIGAIRPFECTYGSSVYVRYESSYLHQIVSAIKRLSSVFFLFCSLFCQPMFFHARQFPFRNERAIWKLYKSVDEA